MVNPRVNDAQLKHLRARLRGRHDPCHICGHQIDYDAHHHDPSAFQMDHLLQVANGGPEHDPENVAASHRACNRARSDKIDDIAIRAAAMYGVSINQRSAAPDRPCGTPDGQLCDQCRGTHNPSSSVTFVTSRNWWTKPA
jgi:hypothetical protein